MNRPASPSAATARPIPLTDRLARSLMLRHLAGISSGELTLQDAGGVLRLGHTAELSAHIVVHRPRFFRRAILGGTLASAESYLQGDWDCDDLTSLFRIFLRNRSVTGNVERGWGRVATWLARCVHQWRANTRAGSRRNIGAHYDLGNDFFRLWLDDTWAYSSGIFPSPEASLREASIEKFDRVCRKLALRPEHHVLEIGGGWGGFALHAAEHYGCRITTTTVSRRQFELARQRIEAANLGRKITLVDQDYRDLRGQFDRLVSIEMIEAVGHRFLDTFFSQCGRLLRPDGAMLLQAIVMPDRGYEQYLKSVDFIQRFVFPGGCLPSLVSMLASVGRTSDLRLVHAEDFAGHYAQTLRDWRRALYASRDAALGLGYSQDLLRLWTYYLCYCEAAFEERHVGVLQLHFDKPQCRSGPLELPAKRTSAGGNGASPHGFPQAFEPVYHGVSADR